MSCSNCSLLTQRLEEVEAKLHEMTELMMRGEAVREQTMFRSILGQFHPRADGTMSDEMLLENIREILWLDHHPDIGLRMNAEKEHDSETLGAIANLLITQGRGPDKPHRLAGSG